jgi:integrase
MAEGIEVRHRKGCRSLSGGRCGCDPSYRAIIWSNVERKQIRRSFPTLAEAKAWRSDAATAVRKGTMRTPAPTTIAEAWAAWLEGAKAGLIQNRSGEPYKPSAIRGYEKAMRREVLPVVGSTRLTALRLVDVQDLVDELQARPVSPSTIVTVLNPLRAIYRRAMNRGEVFGQPDPWARAAGRHRAPRSDRVAG